MADKKGCALSDTRPPRLRTKRSAALEADSKTKDFLENVEGHTIIEAVNTLGAKVERQSADVALLRASVNELIAGQAKILEVLTMLEDGLEELRSS